MVYSLQGINRHDYEMNEKKKLQLIANCFQFKIKC